MRSIVKLFPGVRALDDVNLEVRKGEIHAICGENGAGKSTLMKVLSGVWPYGTYEGDIYFDGKICRFSTINQSEDAGIVIIHQELALIPELSIAENIFLGNERADKGVINWVSTHARAQDLLTKVGLHEDSNTPVKDLGVGKQQLVEIAKALSKDVRLLILDEPTAALNEAESAHLLDLMRAQRDAGVSQIIISHKLNEISEIADRVTVIRDGKTIETMDVTDGHADEARIIRAMVGRPMDSRFPPRESNPGDVLFEMKDWWVRHPINPNRWVCKGSSFNVRAGEVIGLAGLMGAGRTELARSLFGHTYGIYESGQLYKNGEPITINTVQQAIDHGIAYVSEDRKALGLNLLDDVKYSTVMAKLSKAADHGVLKREYIQRTAEDYRRDLRIKAHDVGVNVGTLSGGNQQKVVLAKWMFTDPDVLILDEPTRGIDVGAKYEIYQVINDLVAAGKAVILISSELPELLGVSDRIYTIFEGNVTGEVLAKDADQESLMRLMTDTSNVA
ncbi:multiple monosaccharide ABC transporter ATP-binding protein [Stomatohabitans albus]|uniref:multiple monosaccharide ABC transporter ATP-binding protein n=1 Tax=Stomatohabitans albus TaxID=3110766 RepID=UPI00300C491E